MKDTVRQAQVVSTYGPGAMIAVRDESFMVTGIDRWDEMAGEPLSEPRLERQLGVVEFRRPPVDDGDAAIRLSGFRTCIRVRRVSVSGPFAISRHPGKKSAASAPMDLLFPPVSSWPASEATSRISRLRVGCTAAEFPEGTH